MPQARGRARRAAGRRMWTSRSSASRRSRRRQMLSSRLSACHTPPRWEPCTRARRRRWRRRGSRRANLPGPKRWAQARARVEGGGRGARCTDLSTQRAASRRGPSNRSHASARERRSPSLDSSPPVVYILFTTLSASLRVRALAAAVSVSGSPLNSSDPIDRPSRESQPFTRLHTQTPTRLDAASDILYKLRDLLT
jgi:hypothetical protein